MMHLDEEVEHKEKIKGKKPNLWTEIIQEIHEDKWVVLIFIDGSLVYSRYKIIEEYSEKEEKKAYETATKRANNNPNERVYVVTKIRDTDTPMSEGNIKISYIASNKELGRE